ncbi:MAG: glycine--tRNA ligase subunit beta [Buchnera aphidicola (Nurudea yanoniella)]
MKKTFLLEIGTEELPPKSLHTIIQSLEKNMISLLNQNYIQFSKILCFSTPRRLAIKIKQLNTHIKRIKKTYKGPLISNAFNNVGHPTKSTKCWMKKIGITINQTSRIIEKQKEWLSYEYYLKHETIEKKLIEISINSIKNISVPTFMKWNIENIQFSRPIRNIVMLLDNEIIKGTVLGLKTNRLIFWNIFTKNKNINLLHAQEYPKILLNFGRIIADHNERKNVIIAESKKMAQNIKGYLKIKQSLLEEITSLVEWPVVLLGTFKKKFLDLPNEILTYIIENQQKCFSIYNIDSKKITNNFIIIANVMTKDSENIIIRNEYILNSQLFDAQFFFKKDQKNPLNEYQPLLKNIIFQSSLGSIFEKIKRMEKLISWIIEFTQANFEDCIRAVQLCKCDLVTNMVFEFPEMQGIIGMYYALKNNEPKNIALAIKEHYLPRFSKDMIPLNPISFSLALTDKIDTLVGLFIIGKNLISKNKDPFSLRRLAIGIIQIILKRKISIDILKLLKKSLNTYEKIKDKNIILENLKKFILEKIYFIYIKKKYNTNIIKSVLEKDITYLIDIDIRIRAVSKIQNLNILQPLITTYKRIYKILQSSKKISLYNEINSKLLKTPEEKNIVILLQNIQKKVSYFYLKKDYISVFFELKNFNKPISNFFENVRIQDENCLIKKNRLTILKKITDLFVLTIDFTLLY